VNLRAGTGSRWPSTALGAALLVLAAATLSGCDGGTPAAGPTATSSTSPAGGPGHHPAAGGITTSGQGSAGSQGSAAANAAAQQAVKQLEGTIDDAQSTLDGLDQDFAGDAAASGDSSG